MLPASNAKSRHMLRRASLSTIRTNETPSIIQNKNASISGASEERQEITKQRKD